MRTALLIQWAAVLSILVGFIGGCFYHALFLLIPLGFLTSIVNSVVASYKMAKAADIMLAKVKKENE